MRAASKRSIFLVAAISVVALIVGFVAAAIAIATTQDDPRAAGLGAYGRQGNVELRGVLFAAPYPHLRTAPEDGFPQGRTLPIANSNGKRGVEERAAELNGETIDARGFVMIRGDGQMLQAQPRRLRPSADPAPIALTEPVDLGRWRLSGEICDGQCVLGAMRPGRGLAHKACANFCIQGGVPPMFVTEEAVEGSQFMLLATAQGGPPPAAQMEDLIGLLVTVEGRLERRGDLLFFFVDLETAEAI